MSTSCGSLFSIVQKSDKGNRWVSFVASYIVQAAAVTALVFYAVTAPTFIAKQAEHVELVAPGVETSQKVAQVKPKTRPLTRLAPVRTAVLRFRIEAPVLQAPQPQRVRRVTEVAEIAQPRLSIASPKYDSKVLNALPGPKAATKIVATNTFGGSSAAPTLQKVAPSRVQTGGFGDPNGVPTNAHGSNRPNIAATGSFDLPPGGGYGNGTGGTSGARGTIASAGFGNGIAGQGGGGRGGNAPQAHIQATSFVAPTVAPATPDLARRAKAASHPAASPVSIQSKPTPVYTLEARKLKVEGEVLLNVIFTAEGQIRILNVVHGLGYVLGVCLE